MTEEETAEALMMGQLMGAMEDEERRKDVIRLPFSYPGSKFDQLNIILPELPYRKKYGEAFGGSGIVMLNREPSDLEILNDRYMGVTSMYRVIRDRVKMAEFMERLQCCLHSREEFIWCKSTWRDVEDDIERAARWFYTIIFSVNSKPESTFGRSLKSTSMLTHKYFNQLPLFWAVHERLKWSVQIENLDWRTCLNDYDCEDMVWYLDPTYLGTGLSYEFNMTEHNHIELCERIFKLQGFVALSGYNNPETSRIYDSYNWTRKITWQRKSEMLVYCDTQMKAIQTETSRKKAMVEEALWILEA